MTGEQLIKANQINERLMDREISLKRVAEMMHNRDERIIISSDKRGSVIITDEEVKTYILTMADKSLREEIAELTTQFAAI